MELLLQLPHGSWGSNSVTRLSTRCLSTEQPHQPVFNCFRAHIGKRTSHLLATTLQYSPWIWGTEIREGPQGTRECTQVSFTTCRLLPQQLCAAGYKPLRFILIPWLLPALEEIPSPKSFSELASWASWIWSASGLDRFSGSPSLPCLRRREMTLEDACACVWWGREHQPGVR